MSALTTLNKVINPQRLPMSKNSKMNNPLVHCQRVWHSSNCHSSLSSKKTSHQLVDCLREGEVQLCSAMKGTGLPLTKELSDVITSIVAEDKPISFTKSDPTHARRGMGFMGSKSFSLPHAPNYLLYSVKRHSKPAELPLPLQH